MSLFGWRRRAPTGMFWAHFLAGWLVAIVTLGATPTVKIDWTEGAVFPEARAGCAAGKVEGRLILAGGTYWTGAPGAWEDKVFCAAVHAYDPVSDAWEQLPDAPVEFGYAAGATDGERLFVLGGVQNNRSSRDVWIMERQGGRFCWRAGPRLPESRVFANAAVIDGRLFVAGGTRQFETLDEAGLCCSSVTADNSVWILDLADPNGNWRKGTPFPGAKRWTQRTATVGHSIYQFGGRFIAHKDAAPEYFDEVWRYDTFADEWSEVGPLPSELQLARPVVAGESVLLIGRNELAMEFDPDTGSFARVEGLPRNAMVDYFAWFAPYIIGAGGETAVAKPRRRANWTFVGKVAPSH